MLGEASVEKGVGAKRWRPSLSLPKEPAILQHVCSDRRKESERAGRKILHSPNRDVPKEERGQSNKGWGGRQGERTSHLVEREEPCESLAR